MKFQMTRKFFSIPIWLILCGVLFFCVAFPPLYSEGVKFMRFDSFVSNAIQHGVVIDGVDRWNRRIRSADFSGFIGSDEDYELLLGLAPKIENMILREQDSKEAKKFKEKI